MQRFTENETVVRHMELSDVAEVEILERESFSDAWSQALLRDAVTSRLDYCYVLEFGGRVCAYGIMRVILDEGELLRIAVANDMRGRGLAKRLMDTILFETAQLGAAVFTLEVREGNQPARKLYSLYGFKEEAVRRDYYTHPVENAVIMWKR